MRQTNRRIIPTMAWLIGAIAPVLASEVYAQVLPNIAPPPASSIADTIQRDSGRPGDGDDTVVNHPDFAWKKNWVETPEWGGRIGYLDTTGTFRVRLTRGDSSPWVVLAHNVKDFQLMDWRVAVLRSDGRLLFAEGPLSTPLRLLERDVAWYQMTLTRMGILKNDGTFLIKEHGFLPRKIATEVKAFQVLMDRVGVLKQDGSFHMHEGGHIHQLTHIADNVQRFQLEREWVAMTRANKLMLGKGSPSKLEFIEKSSNIRDFEMEVTVDLGQRLHSRLHLAIADSLGQVHIGEGEQPDFRLQAIPVAKAKRVQWSGRRLAIHGEDGMVHLGDLREEAGDLQNLRSAGGARALRLNQEGALLLSRAARHLSMLATERDERTRAVAGIAQTATLVARGAATRTSAEEELLPPGGAISDVMKFEISSIRPTHTRRPMGSGAADLARP